MAPQELKLVVSEEAIVDALNRGNSYVQQSAIYTLETMGTEKCIPDLMLFFKRTRDQGVRANIDNTIYQIDKRTAAATGVPIKDRGLKVMFPSRHP